MDISKSFRRGDIVQLSSSDQRMVIDEIEEGVDVVVCKWYEGHQRQVRRFCADALRHVQ